MTASMFTKLGVKGLEDEVMWRGCARKKGFLRIAAAWFRNLFEQATNYP
jgi:hypothetical protein